MRLSPERFVSQRVDMVIHMEDNIMQSVKGEFCMALGAKSQSCLTVWLISQLAVKKILEAIYEPRFLNCMYGFRPNRGCHDAIKEVQHHIKMTAVSIMW